MDDGMGSYLVGPILEDQDSTQELSKVQRLKSWIASLRPWLERGRQFLAPAWPVLRRVWWTFPPVEGRRKWPTWIGIGLARFVGFVLILGGCVDLNVFWLFGRSPGFSELRNPPLATATEIRSADDVLLGKIWLEDRTPLSRDQIPEIVVKALVATEDERFFSHKGIDPLAPFSAAWSTLRGGKRGGSTLAQQLAKNLFQTRQNRGLLGFVPGLRVPIAKMREWILASKLELLHSKDEILTLYLNTVTFGNNTWGLHSASMRYFGKPAKDLQPQEAALLVGLLKGPSVNNPFTRPHKALARRNVVLNQLVRAKVIDKKLHDSLAALPLGLHPTTSTPSTGLAPHFRDWITAWLKDWCKDNDCDPFTDGLVVRTTLDSRMQTHAQDAMSDFMPLLQKRFDNEWSGQAPWRYKDGREIPGYLDSLARGTGRWIRLMDSLDNDTVLALKALRRKERIRVYTPNGYRDTLVSPIDSIRMTRQFLQGAMVAMDPRSGAIKAWVGGIDHEFSKLDHVAGTRRSNGSTAKAFVYATALEQGMAPCDKFVDEVRTFSYQENGETKRWTPHNADWVSNGDTVSLRNAFGRSLNTVTSQVIMKVGPENVAATMMRLGIKSPLKAVPSVGLGANPVTLLELAGAYQPFVNGGKAIEPWAIERIEDRQGKVLATFSHEPKQVLTENVAWLMTHMLRGGFQEPDGTSLAMYSYNVFQGGRELGGKTGTSSEHADGWYVSVTTDLVTAAWTGNDDPSLHFRSGMTGEGSRTGLPIVGRFLERVFKDPALPYPPEHFPTAPRGLKTSWNCPTPWPKDTLDSTAIDTTAVSTIPPDGTIF